MKPVRLDNNCGPWLSIVTLHGDYNDVAPLYFHNSSMLRAITLSQ